jgi:hypothetical protein
MPDCGNPYLYWHHFDPPWREREHHEPQGMIALCAEHHAKADAGAYTKRQLSELKRQAGGRPEALRGRFEWMRRDLLAVVGGNFYYQTYVIFSFHGVPRIWFNRDDDGCLLLNVRMPTTSGLPRTHIEENFWLSAGQPVDLECPPSGRLLKVDYSNGDAIRVEFFELDSLETALARYPDANIPPEIVSFPLTAVEVLSRVGGTQIEFGPSFTRMGGLVMTNGFFSNVGIALDVR